MSRGFGKKVEKYFVHKLFTKNGGFVHFQEFRPLHPQLADQKKTPRELSSGTLSPQMIERAADVVVEVLTAIMDFVVEVGKNLACAVVNQVTLEVAIFKSCCIGVEQFVDVIALDTECGSDFLKTKFEVKHFIFSFLLGFVPPFVIILYHIRGDLSRVFQKVFLFFSSIVFIIPAAVFVMGSG